MKRKGIAIALLALGFILAFGSLLVGKTRAVDGYITIDHPFVFLVILMLVGTFLAVVGVGILGARNGFRW